MILTNFDLWAFVALMLFNMVAAVFNCWFAARNVTNSRHNLERYNALTEKELIVHEWLSAKRIVEMHEAGRVPNESEGQKE